MLAAPSHTPPLPPLCFLAVCQHKSRLRGGSFGDEDQRSREAHRRRA